MSDPKIPQYPRIQRSLDQISEADRAGDASLLPKYRESIPVVFSKVARQKAIAHLILFRCSSVLLLMVTLVLGLAFTRGAIVQSKLLVQEVFYGEVR